MSKIFQHPQAAWVRYRATPQGLHVHCLVCRADQHIANTVPALNEFARAHQQHQAPSTHLPVGDAVARVTGAVGLKPCTPCEQRRLAMNNLVPKNNWLTRLLGR